jgi:hypothetical protein
MHRSAVIECVIAGIKPFGKWTEEAFFQQPASGGYGRRQRGKDLEFNSGIGAGAPIQRIDESIRFADAERDTKNDALADSRQQVIDASFRVIETGRGSYRFLAPK